MNLKLPKEPGGKSFLSRKRQALTIEVGGSPSPVVATTNTTSFSVGRLNILYSSKA